MENKIKIYNLKVPSSPVVTINNCWEILKIVSRTGKVFLDTDLVKGGSPVNEKNLFRILSYLKYLGFLYEKREKEEVNGKIINTQRWFENEKSEITDFFFFLRDNRENEAKDIFIKIIKDHDIYNAIANDLLKTRPSATKIELKDYLRRKLPGKRPGYYDVGVKATLEILKFCELIKVEGNIFSLVEQKLEMRKETLKVEAEESELEGVSNKKDLGRNKYIISIYGENTNFQFPINNKEDIIDVETILGIIKRKLS
ncbi:MAG TPA: hypothetical protein VI911_00020 [Patescibacteria group bacterium]|nr:hypothetical protein [Patescibacteria group bacterium]